MSRGRTTESSRGSSGFGPVGCQYLARRDDLVRVAVQEEVGREAPYTLHHTPYTLHPASCTLYAPTAGTPILSCPTISSSNPAKATGNQTGCAELCHHAPTRSWLSLGSDLSSYHHARRVSPLTRAMRPRLYRERRITCLTEPQAHHLSDRGSQARRLQELSLIPPIP